MEYTNPSAHDREHSLGVFNKLISVFDSIHKYQSINTDKTIFIHILKTPDTQPITCENGLIVPQLELGKSTSYLAFSYLIVNSN